MIVAVPKETFPGEKRVALVPTGIPPLVKAGFEVVIEPGAGLAAGFRDEQYVAKGAKIATGRDEVFAADVVLQVRAAGSNPDRAADDYPRLRKGGVLIASCDPLGEPKAVEPYAAAGVTLFALEMVPRITRAQSMDILSSMATVAGYRAVLLAAEALPKMFPMLMTAAGTVSPAKVLIVGAGVAGLQAIATAKRLGAVVTAYDIRPAVKEQCQSLGAKFLELELDTAAAEDKGGYAQAMDEQFYRKQREMMTRVIAEMDLVITTAAVPGKKAPILVTREMVEGMAPGSVVMDLAAERGGNCELTRPGETVVHQEVTILGPVNLASGAATHASQMYGKNITTFLLLLAKKGRVELDLEDEIIRDTLITHGGHVVNERVCEALGIAPPAAKPAPEPVADEPPQDIYGVKKDN
ncbi:MAG TPA: Re/Si-specific NAD(P)(+) transhydrogenase subunit alpha [Planctomycetaceae bacterium]|nr:Re/Si-specific NAD(P)(+) transhydrogenase subunit alpha [Planctomycetaceae bacterium]